MDMLKEYLRMCKSNNCGNCQIGSKAGPLESCEDWIVDHYDEGVSIIRKWAEEHPKKTYEQDFIEKFPNALKEDNGELYACVRDVYGVECLGATDEVQSCKECWNLLMEY